MLLCACYIIRYTQISAFLRGLATFPVSSYAPSHYSPFHSYIHCPTISDMRQITEVDIPGVGRAIPAVEAAKRLGLTRQTIHDAVSRGIIKAYALARLTLVPLSEVKKYQNLYQGKKGPKSYLT